MITKIKAALPPGALSFCHTMEICSSCRSGAAAAAIVLQLPYSMVEMQENAEADQQEKESRQKAEIFQRTGCVKDLREQANTG